MGSRIRWRFGGVALGCLLLGVVGHSQQPPLPANPAADLPAAPTPVQPIGPAAVPPTGNPALIPATPVPAAPRRQTIEELIAAVRQVRTRKAELERQEKALLAELEKRVADQNKQLKELGLGGATGHPEDAAAAGPATPAPESPGLPPTAPPSPAGKR